MADLVMPRLSDTMEEGTILRWLKHDGDDVHRGDELVEIETDKANMIYQSDLDGTLQTVAVEGDALPVGALIAHIGDGARGAPASVADDAREKGDAAGTRAPSTRTGAAAEQIVEALVETVGGGGGSGAPRSEGERLKASPLARRIARENGVDLHTLSGSGPGGRIVKADVHGAAGARAPEAAPPTPVRADDVTTAKGQTKNIELSRMQQTIARRMAESKATIPDFTLLADVDMDECVRLRGELKRISKDEAPTYNDMVVKACALALRDHPRANGSYRDGSLALHSRINIGVAVAGQDALVVPTVFDADAKALGEIARETRSLAARVRDATITPPELGGGTFTVSNLGMYGIASFTAIINPPQAAILSVGSVQQRAVVREDELVARHTMTLTLVCDHRALYGADAAELLARIRELLQAPAALTL